MCDNQKLSDSGGRDTDPGALIQYLEGREPIIHELWCHGLEGLCHEFHPTARIDIPTVTVGGLIT